MIEKLSITLCPKNKTKKLKNIKPQNNLQELVMHLNKN